MPILRTIKNNAVIYAMFIGTLTGLVGVGLFVFILQAPIKVADEEIIVTSQVSTEEEPFQQAFFALQHGVFSNFDSAAQFLAANPTLNKAGVIEVEKQYFVWSRIDIEKIEDIGVTVPSSFYKKLTLSSSCPVNVDNKIPATLKDTKWLTLSEAAANAQEGVPADWVANLTEVQKLSADLSVIRLHMLINYYEGLDCLKITF